MKAVVLCAGIGSRLGSLTTQVPKVMLPLNGHPLLSYILAVIKKSSINEVAINLHSHPQKIRDFLGDGSRFGLKIQYSFETELLGTAGALWQLRDWLKNEEDFLVFYGDILTNQDLQPLIDCHRQQRCFATLLVHQRFFSNSIVELDCRGRISGFVERPNEHHAFLYANSNSNTWVNSAIQVLSRRALKNIGDNRAVDLPRDLYVPMVDKEKLFGVPLTGQRVAIDSPQRYAEACELVRHSSFRPIGENR